MPRDFPFPQNAGDRGEDREGEFVGGMGEGLQGPRRIVEMVEVFPLPSGRVRELRMVSYTVPEGNNTYRTSSRVEAVPPLDCSCSPLSMLDIAECVECLAVVCASRHSFTCWRCGRVFCSGCRAKDVGEDVPLCEACYAVMRTPWLIRILKKIIWGE